MRRNEAEKKSLEMKEENDRIARDMYRSDYSGRRPMGAGGRGGGYRNRDGHRPLPPAGPPNDHHHPKNHPAQGIPPMQQQQPPSRNYRGDNRGGNYFPQGSGAPAGNAFRHGRGGNTAPSSSSAGLERRWEMPASDAGPASKRPPPEGNNPGYAHKRQKLPPPPPPPRQRR